MRVIVSPGALQDLDDIFEFLYPRNPQAAHALIDRIEHAMMGLAEHPALGRPGRTAKTRELVVTGTPFLVAYRIDAGQDEVHVIAIWHGARGWPDGFE